MKVWISEDEWYPVYDLEDGYGSLVDVPAKQVADWKRIFAEFARVQLEMEKILIKRYARSKP